MLPDNDAMKLQVCNRRKSGKITNMGKLDKALLKNQWDKKKSQGKLENALR